MARKNNITDMTEGGALGHILRFMMPLLVGNLFQQFYNVVDSVVVGNFVGANALAAVGTCGSPSFFFFALSSGLAIGIGILAAQFFGAKDAEMIRATIANSIWILVVAGGVVSVLGYLLAPTLMHWMQAPEAVYADAVTYLRVTSLGIVAIALYNGVAALLRALGDSRSPLYFLIISCVINIVLDLFFVLQLGLGVYGVALATVLAQVFSFVISAVYAWWKVPYFRLTRRELRPRQIIIFRCLKLGIPMAMQSSLIAVSIMVLQSVVNSFGETIMASYTVVNRVDQLIQQPYMSLCTAITSFCGQNMGAGKLDRVRHCFRLSVRIVLLLSLSMIPIFFLLGSSIAGIFVREQEVISIAARAMCIDTLFFFFLGMIYVPRGVLNGCGDAGFALVNGISEVVCRILFAHMLTRIPAIGFWGLWLTNGLTWLVTSSACSLRYFLGGWKNKSAVS